MTTTEQTTAPEFAIAMRGYDRLQVDEYVSQLNAWVAEAESRQTMAESFVGDRDRHIESLERRIRELEADQQQSQASAAVNELSERITKALDEVIANCNDLHTRTQARCGEILKGARRDAQAVVDAARETVAELESVARTEAQQVTDAANAYRTSADAEVERLRTEHQRVLEQLSQLRGSLEGLISAPVAVLAAVDDITGHRADASSNGRQAAG